MNSRGYGLKGRTAFSNYKFYFRDGIALIILAALIITLIFLTHGGYANITFYPFYELNLYRNWNSGLYYLCSFMYFTNDY